MGVKCCTDIRGVFINQTAHIRKQFFELRDIAIHNSVFTDNQIRDIAAGQQGAFNFVPSAADLFDFQINIRFLRHVLNKGYIIEILCKSIRIEHYFQSYRFFCERNG